MVFGKYMVKNKFLVIIIHIMTLRKSTQEQVIETLQNIDGKIVPTPQKRVWKANWVTPPSSFDVQAKTDGEVKE